MQQAAGAHAPRSGWHSFDYYAPTTGNDRWHDSAEGAPIYVVGQSGRKSEGGTGGGYGNYGYVLDENGNVVSKSGHGDTQGTAFAGGTFGGALPTDDVPDTSPPTQTPQQEAVERVTNYKEMSKSQMDNAYDKMRADDPNKAAIEGMKMHKAFFNK